MSAADNAGRCHSRDRADIVSRTVLQIITRTLRAWADYDPKANIAGARAEIVTLLREEFDKISQKTRDEIRLVD